MAAIKTISLYLHFELQYSPQLISLQLYGEVMSTAMNKKRKPFNRLYLLFCDFRACINYEFYMINLPVDAVVAEDDEEVESSVCEVLSGGQW